MIKVGITGQAGFIGTHISNYLKIHDGYEIIDFKDEYYLDKLMLESWVEKCDIIIHLAGVNRHHDNKILYNLNIEITEKLIQALEATESTPHVIFSSSIQERKKNEYGKAKKIARELLAEWAEKNSAKFTGLIMPNVYGPFCKPYYNSVVATFCYQLLQGIDPCIDNDVELNLIFIDELMEIIIKCINNSISQPYFEVPVFNRISVSELKNKLSLFNQIYIFDHIFPDLNKDFDKNLFNTFRSYIDLQKYFPVNYKNNLDKRGSFVEILKIMSGGQVSFSTTKPMVIRGNHFHTRKIERFSIIKGKAKIQLRKYGTKEVLGFNLSSDNPAFIDIPIWYAHNLINIGNEDLVSIFWVDEFYNKDDPDTYILKV